VVPAPLPDLSPEAISRRTGLILRREGEESGGEEALAHFLADLRDQGVRLGGVIQRTRLLPPEVEGGEERKIMELIDLSSGGVLSMTQDLGSGAGHCALDESALAEGAQIVRAALESGVDLLLVNKFSNRESAGKGMLAEIFDAMSRGCPLLTTISPRHLTKWREMAGDLGSLLAPDEEAVRRWWQGVRQAPTHLEKEADHGPE